MSEGKNWMDDLLEQVAAGRMLPQDALAAFFLRKREEEQSALTEADHAFLTAMDAAETAQIVAKWCARNAAVLGGVVSVSVDLRFPSFFHMRRRPPLVTALDAGGKRITLFCPADAAAGEEYAEDCLRASGSFSGAQADPVFLPVFRSALNTALRGHGLPAPEYTT